MSEQRIRSIETPLYVVRDQPLTRIIDELRRSLLSLQIKCCCVFRILKAQLPF